MEEQAVIYLIQGDALVGCSTGPRDAKLGGEPSRVHGICSKRCGDCIAGVQASIAQIVVIGFACHRGSTVRENLADKIEVSRLKIALQASCRIDNDYIPSTPAKAGLPCCEGTQLSILLGPAC